MRILLTGPFGNVGSHTAGPDTAQPLPFAFGAVGVERDRVVERPRLDVGDPGPHQRPETFQQFVGGAGQRQPRCADFDVQRGMGVGHARTVASAPGQRIRFPRPTRRDAALAVSPGPG